MTQEREEALQKRNPTMKIVIAILMFVLTSFTVYASEVIDISILCDAIYRAEGVNSAKPYGILKDYCSNKSPKAVAQCRKGCIQTITKWQKKLVYSSPDEFIRKFSEIYAPTKGSSLRPAERKLNVNWYRNVSSIYSRLVKKISPDHKAHIVKHSYKTVLNVVQKTNKA
jgi:hypothetical protein